MPDTSIEEYNRNPWNEPPLWLAAATMKQDIREIPIHFPTLDFSATPLAQLACQLNPKLKKHSKESQEEKGFELLLFAHNNSRHTTALHLTFSGEALSEEQWTIMAKFFPRVRQLYLTGDTGIWDYFRNFPRFSSWSLGTVIISESKTQGAGSDVLTRGLLDHLVLYKPHSLLWGGTPASFTNYMVDLETWETGTLKGVEYYTPSRKGGQGESEEEGSYQEESRLRKLEILEGCAPAVFASYAFKHFGALENLEELRIRALDWADSRTCDPTGLLSVFLPHLKKLRHLDLSLAHFHLFEDPKRAIFIKYDGEDERYDDSWQHSREGTGRWLIDCLPSSLETFYFRGSVAMGSSEVLQGWADAFSNPEYLPQLKKVSFLLDQPEIGNKVRRKDADGNIRKVEEGVKPKEGALEAANDICRMTLGPILSKRGVQYVKESIEWRDPWFDQDWPGDLGNDGAWYLTSPMISTRFDEELPF